MDLQPYVDRVRHELAVAAATGGADAEALAARLTAPLDSAIRLVLLEALSEAAELITRDLAPNSVAVQLCGRDPEFSVSSGTDSTSQQAAIDAAETDEDGGTWRVTLRLPERLRPRVDSAARGEGLSVNAWLVRAVVAALAGTRHGGGASTKNFSGWVR